MSSSLDDEQRVKLIRVLMLASAMLMLGLLGPVYLERFQSGTMEPLDYAIVGGLVAVVLWAIRALRKN